MMKVAAKWSILFVGALSITWALYGSWWVLPAREGWYRLRGIQYFCCIEPRCKMCSDGRWLWKNRSCACRQACKRWDLSKVCPECLQGLNTGKMLMQAVLRTARGFSLFLLLLLLPLTWGYWKRIIIKKGA